MNVFDLQAKISLDDSGFTRGLAAAGKRAKTFAKVGIGAIVAGSAIVAGAFTKAAKSTADYGDNVDKTSQKLGLSAEGFQKWDYVMKIAGTDMNSMGVGLKTLTNKIDDAKNGSKDAQGMFKKLGVSMEDLNKMSREEAFEATIKGFQGMKDSTERAALANDLFGRSGQNLTPLFNQTAKKTEEQLKLAEKYGMVMPEAAVKASAAFKDSMTTMSMTFTGFKNRLMGNFLPSITKVTNGLALVFAGDYDKGLDKINSGITKFVGKISEALPKVMEMGGQIVSALGEAIIQNLPMLMGASVDLITQLITGIVENLPLLIESAGQIITAFANGLVEGIPKIVAALQEAAPAILEAGKTLFTNLVNGLSQNGPALLSRAADWVSNLVNGILNALPQLLTAAANMVRNLLSKLSENLPKFVEAAGEWLRSLATGIVEYLPEILDAAWNLLTALLEALIEGGAMLIQAGFEIVNNIVLGIKDGIVSILSPAAEAIKGRVTSAIDALKAWLSGAWAAIKGAASSAWNGIKSTASSVWNAIKSAVTRPVNALKGTLSGAWSAIKSKASSMWDSIKTAVTKPFETAKKTITNIVDGIKGLFPISLGKIFSGIINLPKISIKRNKDGGAEAQSSTSTVSFAKAMNQPYLFDNPTFFQAGEAGDEMLYGRRSLMNDITEAVKGVGGNVVVNLNYNASEDASDMLRDLARGVRRYRMAGVI